MKLLILNGVNLNMTGRREKGVYGTETLEDINAQIERFCKERGASCEFFQSNIEGELCTNVHAREEFRHHSVISEVCRGTVLGFGKISYLLAVESFLL